MPWSGGWLGGWGGGWSGSLGAAAPTPTPPTSSITLFGVDIAGVIAQAMGPGLLAATLIKVFPGTRTSGNLAGGTNASTLSYPARGFTESYRASQIDGDLVRRGDRKVVLLGATIPGRVVPEAGDRLTIEGRTFSVVRVERDPAAATYTLQVRGP